ncbi:glucoside xylosyltransferase 1-like, partial [Ixodes scapularis]
MSRRRAAADQAESGDEPDAEGLMARVANLCDTVTQRLLLTDPGLQGRGPRPQVPVPTYTGYDDRKSVADFLAELAAYKLAAGASDEYVLARVLPVALQASAARWWRIVAPEPVTLVVVTCAGSLELTMANLKSAVAFSRAPLRLILYADEENIKLLQDRDMLPMEDAVLYVDADALFLNPVENIWDVFEKMNDSHLMALVHEIEDEANNWYKLEAKHPFVPPFGVNAGVMAMNLTRMRNFRWVSRMGPLLEEYEDRIFLGDQDLVNIMFSAHPDKLFLMTCRWNYRQENCVFHSSCSGETPALVHGSRNCFTDPDREPSIYAIHSVMQK